MPVAVAFSPDGSYLATANIGSNDVALFNITNGMLSATSIQALPTTSTKPRSLVFISSSGNLFIATVNSDSNDITIFPIKAKEGIVDAGTSYPLPVANVNPLFIAASTNGAYLATANSGSNTITVFTVTNGVLDQGTSYALPAQSSTDVAIAFSSVSLSNGNTLAATANSESNDVSVFSLINTSGDGGSSLPLGVIIGTTVGIPVGCATLTAIVAIGFLLYRYLHTYKGRASVNFSDKEPADNL